MEKTNGIDMKVTGDKLVITIAIYSRSAAARSWFDDAPTPRTIIMLTSLLSRSKRKLLEAQRSNKSVPLLPMVAAGGTIGAKT